jgi:hypothetical protein
MESENVRSFYFCSILLVLTRITVAQGISPAPPQLSAAQIQKIEQLADVYHIDRADALEHYKTAFDQNYLTALRAIDFFEQHKAYEILVLAVPGLEESVKGAAISAVLKKRDFSSSAGQMLLTELDRFNSTKTDDDEARGGYEMMKKRIASALARWMGWPDPNIPLRPFESGPAYRAFVERAKQKAATMANSSPY